MKNEEIKHLIEKYSRSMSKDEGDNLFEFVTNKPDDPDEELWAENILRSGVLFRKYQGNTRSIELLTAAYDDYKSYYPNSFQNKVKILRETCYMQMAELKTKDAHETMNRYLYNALGQVNFVQSLPMMHYYSFRGISDYALKEITEEKISLAHPRMFNDPLDTILVWWLENEIKTGGKNESEMNFRLLMKKGRIAHFAG